MLYGNEFRKVRIYLQWRVAMGIPGRRNKLVHGTFYKDNSLRKKKCLKKTEMIEEKCDILFLHAF